MDRRQLAHLWANKSRESARASNFYFEGDVIYSYGSHFPIARHYKGVVLITSKRRSVSTSAHISATRYACPHLKCFTVADVMREPCAADLKDYREQIEGLAMDAARARDPEWKIKALQGAVNEANEFAEKFGFKTRFEMPGNLAELKERAKIQSAKKAKETAARNARLELENAENLKKWLAGELNSLGYDIQKVYLRRCESEGGELDKEKRGVPRMQTSKGATVPLVEAEKAFRFVMLKREKGWHRNGDSFAVGEFHLDAVNDQGVVAGCHRIEWGEIERFAKTQGWI